MSVVVIRRASGTGYGPFKFQGKFLIFCKEFVEDVFLQLQLFMHGGLTSVKVVLGVTKIKSMMCIFYFNVILLKLLGLE